MSLLTQAQQQAALKLIRTVTPFTDDMIEAEIVTDGQFGQGTIAQALYLQLEKCQSGHNSVLSQLNAARTRVNELEQKHGQAVYDMQVAQMALEEMKKKYEGGQNG